MRRSPTPDRRAAIAFLCIFKDSKLRCLMMPHNARPVHEAKAVLFRVLGHPARVRILEILADGEQSVGALQAALGLDSSGTSQHLAALRRVGVVESRRAGTSVFYRVDDPRVFDLLSAGRDIIGRRLTTEQSMLVDLRN